LQQFLLPLVQLTGGLHTKLDEQIAFAMAVKHRHTFAANAHGRTRLHSFGNFQGVVAFEGGNANLGSECGLAEGNRNHAMQIGALALEERMLLDVQDHIKIASRTTESAGFSQAGETDAGAVFHSRRNLGLDRSLPQDSPLPFALGTWVGDDAARALTGGTSAGHAEESLLVAHLPASRAGAAGDRSFAGSRTRTAAFFTGFMAADYDLRLFAKDRLLELQSDVFAQIRTALGAGTTARASAKKIAETEEVSENLAEVVKDCGINSRRASNPAYSGVAEAVVGASLVGVRQNGIGFTALLELFLSVGVIGIAVRVKLQGQFAVGALDLLLTRPAGNPEDLVVIAFYVASQNRIFAFLMNISFSVWGYVPLGPSPAAATGPSTYSRVATRP
jgi:hypothetical protein